MNSSERNNTSDTVSPLTSAGPDANEDAAKLNQAIKEFREYADTQALHIKKLTEIGIALSAETNLSVLLEKIVDEARRFSNADGGTLYIMNDKNETLEFAIVQNESMKIRMGGTSGDIKWPHIPLKKDAKPNFSNVSSCVAITGKIENIPDVYEAIGFDFSGTKKFDSDTGYRSQSMLVIPMKNKENATIGVLQLINSLAPVTGKPVSFPPNVVDMTASLASQAAVAITNVRLYKELETLFESFIQAIATAIDEKSPYTAGHIRRVQEITIEIARSMNKQAEGPLKDFHLSEDEINELRIASWLHDVGKIVVPEHVVDKATKLEKIFDTADIIAMRYEIFKRDIKVRALEWKLNLYASGEASPEALADIEQRFEAEYKGLAEEKELVMKYNQPGEFMDDEKIEKLKKIALKKWYDNGVETPYLTDEEQRDLSIRKGSLNEAERKIIENHALVTIKMLNKLPFPDKLKHVPEYAGAHHEKLNGTGYPYGLKKEQLPYPSRIIAIADIFEALTASDRPYKKSMPVSKALQILESMRKDGHIDGDILELFIKEKIYEKFAPQEAAADSRPGA